MHMNDAIIRYLVEAYRPEAIIAYGSFAEGCAGEHSDFDALVIAEGPQKHDSSVIGGTVLDVFVYPAETFRQDYDPEEFIQVYDGRIVLDESGIARQLVDRVRQYIDSAPFKGEAELRQEVEWCEKMLARASRGDPEGYYRWHWLLFDSLEIYFDLNRLRYFGPKKALESMRRRDAEGYALYSRALGDFSREALADWIGLLRRLSSDLQP